jgi:hypothetical protein
MSDERAPDEVAPTEISTRMKDYIAEGDTPVELRETVHELYEAVTDDGSGSRYENVRIMPRVAPNEKIVESYSPRSGWAVCQCDLTHDKFAVPRLAPVPMLVADKRKPNRERVWLKTPYVLHPDLMYDEPMLFEVLAQEIDSKIFDLLFKLRNKFNLLDALSEMENLPGSGACTYPRYKGERKGYEIVGDSRPSCSG